ncbi:MAG TPA: hypothetical protein VF719_04695 [Abditibacteriaceae bacterium]|jgi:hypothetical protein
MDEPDGYSAEEIAHFLGMNVEEFFVAAAHADLEAVETDGEHFYRREDVEQFLINVGALDGETAWGRRAQPDS